MMTDDRKKSGVVKLSWLKNLIWGGALSLWPDSSQGSRLGKAGLFFWGKDFSALS
jgi:hypothetical protein